MGDHPIVHLSVSRHAEAHTGHSAYPLHLCLVYGGKSTSLYTTYVPDDDVDAINAAADAVAAATHPGMLELDRLQRVAQDRLDSAEAAHRARAIAQERLSRVLTGKAPFFGRLLVRVGADGSAWLLDPEKQERGFGLRFGSLAELWRAHPELRPVTWGDGDLLVEGLAIIPGGTPHQAILEHVLCGDVGAAEGAGDRMRARASQATEASP